LWPKRSALSVLPTPFCGQKSRFLQGKLLGKWRCQQPGSNATVPLLPEA